MSFLSMDCLLMITSKIHGFEMITSKIHGFESGQVDVRRAIRLVNSLRVKI